MKSAAYVGRFAPSPTGPLHYGSLLAALASYCDARSHQGQWLLRIDDIDPPRMVEGAIDGIQRTLDDYGFEWDGPTLLQSTRLADYQHAVEQLNELSLLYTCACSRKSLKGVSVYPGKCTPATGDTEKWLHEKAQVLSKLQSSNMAAAIRIRISENRVVQDQIQPPHTFHVGADIGDTIVVRRDNLIAYALACAVDDANGITHVVRGTDLLHATGAQLAIMATLHTSMPTYAHIPVVVNTANEKLSKQTKANAIDAMPVVATLKKAWQQLGQNPIEADNIAEFWTQAIAHWQLSKVPKQSQLGPPE